MDIATLITFAEDGAQYFYDATAGIIFDAGLGLAVIVVTIVLGVLSLVTWGIKSVMPGFHRRR